MTERIKNLIVCISMIILVLGLSVSAVIKPETEISVSERRKLSSFPEVSIESVTEGRFMDGFETYAKDQFPLRDRFRTLKALASTKLFGKKDNNGIYVVDSYASALEYPLDQESVANFIEKINRVYDNYISGNDMKVYYSVIPDKNYFLAEENAYPSMDYNEMLSVLSDKFSYMEYIDIFSQLGIGDYYRTDTHWKQDCLPDVASVIKESMVGESEAEYEVLHLDNPFYGVYVGQSALRLKADEINYLSNEAISNMRVYDHENNKEISVYDMKKVYSTDPYEMFLSGPISLITIENDKVENESELIIFRDSFGSSIAPLIAEVYSKVTLVDIRYMRSDILDRYIEFDNQDVLFLYSTMVINNSETFK